MDGLFVAKIPLKGFIGLLDLIIFYGNRELHAAKFPPSLPIAELAPRSLRHSSVTELGCSHVVPRQLRRAGRFLA